MVGQLEVFKVPAGSIAKRSFGAVIQAGWATRF